MAKSDDKKRRRRKTPRLYNSQNGGGAQTSFNRQTRPDLEGSGNSLGGRGAVSAYEAPQQRQGLRAAQDPGGGAGRVRPSRPLMSNRQLEEQRRRASHDASDARWGLRRAVGPISSRGPTASQRKIMASAPTAGDFLAQRLAAAETAAQPDPAQDRAQELGMRRLESDRQFATEARGQDITARGQDVDERLGLRGQDTRRDIAEMRTDTQRYGIDTQAETASDQLEEGARQFDRGDETTRRAQDMDFVQSLMEASSRAAGQESGPYGLRSGGRSSRGGQGEGTFGEQYVDGAIAQFSRAGVRDRNLLERFDTDDPEEARKLMAADMDNFYRRTYDKVGDRFSPQQMQDMYAINLTMADTENRGFWRSILGGRELGPETDAVGLHDKMVEMVQGGGSRALFGFGTTQREAGGRTFNVGNLPGNQRKMFNLMMENVEDNVIAQDSDVGREEQLEFAEQRLEQKKQILRDQISEGTSYPMREGFSSDPRYRRPGLEISGQAQSAEEELARLEDMDAAGYLKSVKDRDSTGENQEDLDEALDRDER